MIEKILQPSAQPKKPSVFEIKKQEFEMLVKQLQDFIDENNFPVKILKVVSPTEEDLLAVKMVKEKLKNFPNPDLKKIIDFMIDYNMSAIILDSLEGSTTEEIEKDDNLRDSIELKLKDLSDDKSLSNELRKKYDKIFNFYFGNRLRINRWNGAWTLYSNNSFGVEFSPETKKLGDALHSLAWNDSNKFAYKYLPKGQKVEFTKTFAKFLPLMLSDFINKISSPKDS